MAGEFVRTPKCGGSAGRYRQIAQLPLLEVALALVSLASFVAALQTGHWFAAPFALLFMAGYGYVAWSVAAEQLGPRVRTRPASATEAIEEAPASGERQAASVARAA
jgi:hypothetical protein